MTKSIPVLLDTDIGSDIDDAVALAYLLESSAIDLVGITTVSGNTEKRARLAGFLCDAAGRGDIPVYAGAREVILHGPGQPEVPQYEAVREGPHRKNFDTAAIEFIRRTVRERPGEITILTIGPLTNIGMLFAIDPEIPSLLKQLVMMCGVFTPGKKPFGPGSREWNALVDPIATTRVYRARPPRSVSVGLEVTTRCLLPAEEVRERFTQSGSLTKEVLKLAEVWFRQRDQITFHDPLAAAFVEDEAVLSLYKGTVTVEPGPAYLEGSTTFSRSNEGPHEIAVDVEPEAFFEQYFRTVGG